MEYVSEKTASLIGELIGLARATDGNEHLITPSSTAVIIEGLAAAASGNVTEDLLARVIEEKRKMVPNCFLCASPCGRTNAYDLGRLGKGSEEIRDLKERILSGIVHIAVSGRGENDASILYTGLIVTGMDDFPAHALLPIAQEIEGVVNK